MCLAISILPFSSSDSSQNQYRWFSAVDWICSIFRRILFKHHPVSGFRFHKSISALKLYITRKQTFSNSVKTLRRLWTEKWFFVSELKSVDVFSQRQVSCVKTKDSSCYQSDTIFCFFVACEDIRYIQSKTIPSSRTKDTLGFQSETIPCANSKDTLCFQSKTIPCASSKDTSCFQSKTLPRNEHTLCFQPWDDSCAVYRIEVIQHIQSETIPLHFSSKSDTIPCFRTHSTFSISVSSLTFPSSDPSVKRLIPDSQSVPFHSPVPSAYVLTFMSMAS